MKFVPLSRTELDSLPSSSSAAHLFTKLADDSSGGFSPGVGTATGSLLGALGSAAQYGRDYLKYWSKRLTPDEFNKIVRGEPIVEGLVDAYRHIYETLWPLNTKSRSAAAAVVNDMWRNSKGGVITRNDVLRRMANIATLYNTIRRRAGTITEAFRYSRVPLPKSILNKSVRKFPGNELLKHYSGTEDEIKVLIPRLLDLAGRFRDSWPYSVALEDATALYRKSPRFLPRFLKATGAGAATGLGVDYLLGNLGSNKSY